MMQSGDQGAWREGVTFGECSVTIIQVAGECDLKYALAFSLTL